MGFSIGRAGRVRAGSHGQRRRALCARLLLTSVALGLFALAGWPEQGAQPVAVAARTEPAVSQRASAKPAPARYSALLDARVTIGATPLTFAEQAPLSAALKPAIADPMQTASLPSSTQISRHAQDGETALSAQSAPPPLVTSRLIDAPLPVPRPADLKLPASPDSKSAASENPRVAAAPPSRRGKAVPAAAAAPQDNRNFIQKLFGVSPREAGTQLAYAAPQDGEIDRGAGLGPGLGLRLTPRPATPPPSISAGAAVYDIKARMVYLPNGERLEAHSGFGEKMDDIRFSHVRMNGVTPPHTYNLVERESLFHGVRAIRLHPVGGSGAIFGRAGLLAHSYLLGPSGQSNGCVSIKDYDRFLQAYLRGEIKRLVVVASL
jgi:hypothetical protein